MNAVDLAYDAWRDADHEARLAEAAVQTALQAYKLGKGIPPSEEMKTKAGMLRHRATERLREAVALVESGAGRDRPITP